MEFWIKVEQIEELSISTALDGIGNQRDLYVELLELMIQEIENSDINLKRFLSENDMHNFRVEVHNMKGSLKSIGAMGIAQKAYDLEIASRKVDVEFCISNLPVFLEELNNLCLKLKEVFSE